MILLRVAGIWGRVWCAQGGWTQKGCRGTQRTAFRIMLPDRYSKTLSEKVNFSSLTVLPLFWLMLRCNKNSKTSSVGTASLIIFFVLIPSETSQVVPHYFTQEGQIHSSYKTSFRAVCNLLKDPSTGRMLFESWPSSSITVFKLAACCPNLIAVDSMPQSS